MKIKNNIIVSICCVLLLVLLIVLLFLESSGSRNLASLSNEMEIQTSEYRLQKRMLQADLDKLRDQSIEKAKGTLSLLFLFEAVDDSFFGEIVPKLNDKNITGTICITDNNLPVVTDVLSVYEINYLKNIGWQTAMHWNGNEDINDWYLETTRLMSEVGIEIPNVIYIDYSNYSTELEKDLVSLGFTDVFVKHSIIGKSIVSSTEELNIFNSFGWYTNEGAAKLTSLDATNSELAFVFGIDGEDVAYDETQFDAMLLKAVTGKEEGNINFATPETAVTFREINKAEYDKALDEYHEKLIQIEAEIADLDAKIDSIYDEYLNEGK